MNRENVRAKLFEIRSALTSMRFAAPELIDFHQDRAERAIEIALSETEQEDLVEARARRAEGDAVSPREKGRHLRERGWVMSSAYGGVRSWQDPENACAGAVPTNEAYDRQMERDGKLRFAVVLHVQDQPVIQPMNVLSQGWMRDRQDVFETVVRQAMQRFIGEHLTPTKHAEIAKYVRELLSRNERIDVVAMSDGRILR